MSWPVCYLCEHGAVARSPAGLDVCENHRVGTYDEVLEKDQVNSPTHYNQGDIECIDGIEAATAPYFRYYLQGNVMKYLWRFSYKAKPLEDLQKAAWYLKKLISVIEREGPLGRSSDLTTKVLVDDDV